MRVLPSKIVFCHGRFDVVYKQSNGDVRFVIPQASAAL